MTEQTKADAVSIAQIIFARRVAPKVHTFLDVEELRQDLAVHVLTALKYYRPEKGSLKTFVGMTFDNWWRQSIRERMTRQANEESRWEMPDVPASSGPSTDQELSDRGRQIIARLPPQTREVAELVIAYGVPMVVAAEMTGTKYQTVNTRVQRARRALKEMAA